jgi:aspartate racemase
LDYYRIINEMINRRLGGNEASKIIVFSVNYGEIVKLTKAGNWSGIAEIICNAAQKLESAGADCLMLGANTMHIIAEAVQKNTTKPLIHIADETAKAIAREGLKKVVLLGTKYTMHANFYQTRLANHSIETVVPAGDDIEWLNDSIYNELGKGIFDPKTKMAYVSLIEGLVAKGIEGVILGCTEIPLLINDKDCSVPVFNTTFIHAAAAVDFSLAGTNGTRP